MKSPNPTHWGLSFSILATLDDVFSDYIVTIVLIGLVKLDRNVGGDGLLFRSAVQNIH